MSIRLEHVSYAYEDNSSKKNYALKEINLEIKKEEFIAVIGHTGSGKSTLIQHLNGLIKPTSGTIYFDDEDIYSEGYPLRELRGKVGICFQYPEHQLFETTILDDVCFGPMNFGKTKEEATEIAVKCLKDVGLSEKLYQKSPFELSGGQKRRVAIAGILAMEPEYFILDEPTAGLDPNERIRFRNLISELSEDRLVLLSTHIVSDIEYIANEIWLMKDGEVLHKGSIEELINSMTETVWECLVPKNRVSDFMEKYKISNMKSEINQIMLRIISHEKPVENAMRVEASLEDVFLYYFGEKAGDENATL
mgnify:CR=1 FL=1